MLRPIHKSENETVGVFLECYKPMIAIYKAMGFLSYFQHPPSPLEGSRQENITEMYSPKSLFSLATENFLNNSIDWNVLFPISENEKKMIKLYIKSRLKKQVVNIKNKTPIDWMKNIPFDDMGKVFSYNDVGKKPAWITPSTKGHCLKAVDTIFNVKVLY